MKVPFVDLKGQYEGIKDEIRVAMDEVLDNTAYILGKPVANFEKGFAKMHGVECCYGVSSGTDGNHLALWALGVGHGDEVIIPADTFIATAWGATLCGATPVFVDVDKESYNLDAVAVARAVTAKTKAIVAVHLYGQATDMEAISYELRVKGYELSVTGDPTSKTADLRQVTGDPPSKMADLRQVTGGVFKHKETGQVIYLVEDCAQSHLAEYKGKRVGGLGAAASFSFYPGKNLGAYGEGGAVCTNDAELGKKFKMMREHGSPEKYKHLMYGHNYRMEGLQGAVLGVKLKYIEKWTEGRRQAASWYKKYLGDCEGVVLPKEMDGNKHVYHLYVIRVNNGKDKDVHELRKLGELNELEKIQISGKEIKNGVELREKSEEQEKLRDKLSKFLGEKGVATGLHYPLPLHLQPCFEHLGYKRGDMPVTEDLADTCLSLPMFPEMTEEMVAFVAECVKEFFNSETDKR